MGTIFEISEEELREDLAGYFSSLEEDDQDFCFGEIIEDVKSKVIPEAYLILDAESQTKANAYRGPGAFEIGQAIFYDDDMPMSYAELELWCTPQSDHDTNAHYAGYAIAAFDEWLEDQGLEMGEDKIFPRKIESR